MVRINLYVIERDWTVFDISFKDEEEELGEMDDDDGDMEDFEDEDEEWGGIQGEDIDMVASDEGSSQDGSDAEEEAEVEDRQAQGEQISNVHMQEQMEEGELSQMTPVY
jgi:hypothetical protein